MPCARGLSERLLCVAGPDSVEASTRRRSARRSNRSEAIHRRSRSAYGRSRVHAELRADGIAIGAKRVGRLMREKGLQGASRRKGVRTTVRDRNARPAPDLVERNFTADVPDRFWVADISYIPALACFLFLAVVVDAFSRRVVGWAIKNLSANRTRAQSARDGDLPAPAGRRHSPFGPRNPVNVDRVRDAVSRDRRAPVDGLCRQLFGQRNVRELLRNAGM